MRLALAALLNKRHPPPYRSQLMKQSEELVSQGEKAFKARAPLYAVARLRSALVTPSPTPCPSTQLNSELRTVKDELEYARQDLGAARAALLPLAVGSVEEEEGEEGQDSYAHVPVPQLARLAAASVKRMSEAARGASSVRVTPSVGRGHSVAVSHHLSSPVARPAARVAQRDGVRRVPVLSERLARHVASLTAGVPGRCGHTPSLSSAHEAILGTHLLCLSTPYQLAQRAVDRRQ